MKLRLMCISMAFAALGAAHAAEIQTAKPWVRWWWPGSAVEPAQLSAQLKAYAEAGIGGVEITPIYGARGGESRDIAYLSPRWVAMLAHTAREAKRLGLGVDMATGTGWPFGGPGVSPEDGSVSLALVDGRLVGKPTSMKVKRAAPGGEGLVLDPYSVPALSRYLEGFSKALAPLPEGAVRSQFHDSFEYFNASWSSEVPAAFLRLNGYDVQDFAAELMGAKPLDADSLGRLKGDYRRTLARLHQDYLRHWVQWSHRNGFQARNQAHGAPGNLLDLYGASDMPETESFGAIRFPIAGLRQDAAEINEDPDAPINLIGRFASSAAHVMGRPLISSETLTWLRENFRETPSAAKPQLDRLFIAGINHVFYHGTTYSPADVEWPGWFFYAATQFNPSNPLWRDLQSMNAYVARVQSVLQAGRPDNDVLLYWPEADGADDAAGLMRQQGMHENAWLLQSSAARTAQALLSAGHSFDFVSDEQLTQLRVEGEWIASPGARHRAIVVPVTRRMPVETLAALLRLREAGAPVLFEALPEDVPGLGRLAERRAALSRLKSGEFAVAINGPVTDAVAEVAVAEGFAAMGLWHIRRARDDGFDYFVVNPTGAEVAGWVPLGRRAAAAKWQDPLNDETGRASLRAGQQGRLEIYLQLASGQSLLLRTLNARPKSRELREWPYRAARGEGVELRGPWEVEFLSGGPALPPTASPEVLGSWTGWSAGAESFSGTARYRLRFDAPGVPADGWRLDLGDVRETARVALNGELLGTAWSLPFRLHLPRLRAKGNVLEIEVTNLPANRVRDLDRRKVEWKVMKDINLASLRYRALDASGWEPAPSGLLGPVRLVPLEKVSP
jgi:hypothetical protein